ncbi:MAG: hypothetical protein Kapaf2KO_10420 [Candidatus Kapaibacteriales bacterium]
MKNYIKLIFDKKEEIHALTQNIFEKKDIYCKSLYLLGIINRTLSNIDAYIQLFNNKNYIASFSIIRLQLDSCLRLYALELVDNSEKLCRSILVDEIHLHKIKDRDGNKMSDLYLHTKLNKQVSNISEVYQNFSSYIHFSDTHILAVFNKSNINTGDYHSSFNKKYITNCHRNMEAITDIVIYLLKRYINILPTTS